MKTVLSWSPRRMKPEEYPQSPIQQQLQQQVARNDTPPRDEDEDDNDEEEIQQESEEQEDESSNEEDKEETPRQPRTRLERELRALGTIQLYRIAMMRNLRQQQNQDQYGPE
jgi:uncharacterized membrane protein YcjF (UPF0283 family)